MAGCARVLGAWKTAWRRHDQYSKDGTWDAILDAVLTDAADADLIDWAVGVGPGRRAHQHATNLPRDTGSSDEFTRICPSSLLTTALAVRAGD